MTSKEIRIGLSSGLEARPAAMLVQVASQYESSIYEMCIRDRQKHPQLAVRCKARKNPGCVVVIEQFSAKFEVELITELVDTLTDMFRLHFQVFVVVKTDFHLILRS